jgi:hypothetical protein
VVDLKQKTALLKESDVLVDELRNELGVRHDSWEFKLNSEGNLLDENDGVSLNLLVPKLMGQLKQKCQQLTSEVGLLKHQVWVLKWNLRKAKQEEERHRDDKPAWGEHVPFISVARVTLLLRYV